MNWNLSSISFAQGWTNPYAGSIKAAVVESSNPKDGYDAATDTGNSLDSSERFRGKDKEKPETKTNIKFHLSAAPGQSAMFVITEVRTD